VDVDNYKLEVTKSDFEFNPKYCQNEINEKLLHIKLDDSNNEIRLYLYILKNKESNTLLTGVLTKRL
jgi:hypothetical protein